ncbi:MAG: hypothetical protein ABJC09_16910 [Terriglobia bacterium]
MTNWLELSRARNLDIPYEAIVRIAPALDSLEQAFRPLSALLTGDIEPAIILSEAGLHCE